MRHRLPARPQRSSVLALPAYLAVSIVFYGAPVLSHPARAYIGTGPDPEIFIWALAWWPHALAHGIDPVYTHVVWAPGGVDLAWTTTVPGLALLLSPVTAAAGPVVAYNVAAVLLPALAAWSAFLLCRHVTHAVAPSLAGGYLYGFSTYMVGHELGHLHLTSVFAVPLVALVVLRYLEGSLGARGLAVRLAALLALQFSFSTELFFTLTLALAAACALAAATVAALRPRLRTLVVPVAAGYAGCFVLVAPLAISALAHFHHGAVNPGGATSADLLGFVAPTILTRAGASVATRLQPYLPALPVENGQYLGLPTVVIVGWLVCRRRRDPGVRFLAAAVVAVAALLGSWLAIRGHRLVPLPWLAVRRLPLFNNVIPVRLSAYLALAAAVAVAVWAAGPRPSAAVRATLTVLAVLAVLPNLTLDVWHTTPSRPPFFADGLYRRCLRPGDTVLALPPPNRTDAMLWQAESGFAFRLANANVSPELPASVPHRSIAAAVNDNDVPAGGGAAVLTLARAQRARAILVDAGDEQWRTALDRVAAGRAVGGIVVYAVGGRRRC